MNELEKRIISDWLSILVRQIDGEKKPSDVSLKPCAGAHYAAIHMQESIQDLKGNLPGFLDFLRNKLNWIVEHDESARTVTANENKPDCVCPLYKEGLLVDPALCECSRGFAEKMFGYIVGKKVEAEVVDSILRKGAHCIYRVTY